MAVLPVFLALLPFIHAAGQYAFALSKGPTCASLGAANLGGQNGVTCFAFGGANSFYFNCRGDFYDIKYYPNNKCQGKPWVSRSAHTGACMEFLGTPNIAFNLKCKNLEGSPIPANSFFLNTPTDVTNSAVCGWNRWNLLSTFRDNTSCVTTANGYSKLDCETLAASNQVIEHHFTDNQCGTETGTNTWNASNCLSSSVDYQIVCSDEMNFQYKTVCNGVVATSGSSSASAAPTCLPGPGKISYQVKCFGTGGGYDLIPFDTSNCSVSTPTFQPLPCNANGDLTISDPFQQIFFTMTVAPNTSVVTLDTCDVSTNVLVSITFNGYTSGLDNSNNLCPGANPNTNGQYLRLVNPNPGVYTVTINGLGATGKIKLTSTCATAFGIPTLSCGEQWTEPQNPLNVPSLQTYVFAKIVLATAQTLQIPLPAAGGLGGFAKRQVVQIDNSINGTNLQNPDVILLNAGVGEHVIAVTSSYKGDGDPVNLTINCLPPTPSHLNGDCVTTKSQSCVICNALAPVVTGPGLSTLTLTMTPNSVVKGKPFTLTAVYTVTDLQGIKGPGGAAAVAPITNGLFLLTRTKTGGGAQGFGCQWSYVATGGAHPKVTATCSVPTGGLDPASYKFQATYSGDGVHYYNRAISPFVTKTVTAH